MIAFNQSLLAYYYIINLLASLSLKANSRSRALYIYIYHTKDVFFVLREIKGA